MKKTYVLDTNVLIQAPDAIYRFKENDLVIPLMVLEELDGLKVTMDLQSTPLPLRDNSPN